MTTNANTNNATTSNFVNNSTKAPSPKQLCWLVNNAKDYGFIINMEVITTSAIASKEITRIQSLIASGSMTRISGVKPFAKTSRVVGDKIWYAIVADITSVSIKSFFGTYSTATAKAVALYGDCVVQVTSNIAFAKTKATDLYNKLEVIDLAPVQEIACDVATDLGESTSTLTELTLDAMNAMSVEELRMLAESMGVELGRSKKHSTIMARILA
jgi:hypothetical protein